MKTESTADQIVAFRTEQGTSPGRIPRRNLANRALDRLRLVGRSRHATGYLLGDRSVRLEDRFDVLRRFEVDQDEKYGLMAFYLVYNRAASFHTGEDLVESLLTELGETYP